MQTFRLYTRLIISTQISLAAWSWPGPEVERGVWNRCRWKCSPLLFVRVGKDDLTLIVLVSISTWVTLPGRPLSLGSAGTPPPSWSPVSSCPFYCISSVFSSVFLLGSRLVLFWYNSAMLVKWRPLQGLDSQFSKDFWSGPRSRSRRLEAQSFQVAQLR